MDLNGLPDCSNLETLFMILGGRFLGTETGRFKKLFQMGKAPGSATILLGSGVVVNLLYWRRK
jgi:hypothetical protein